MSILLSTRFKLIKIILLNATIGVLFGCSVNRDHQMFEKLVDNFLVEYSKFFPIQKCGVGLQDCNDRFDNYAPQHINTIIDSFRSFAQEIELIDKNKLPPKSRVNYDVMIRQINLVLFEFDQSKRWQHDAAFYTDKIHDAFAELLMCQICKDKEKSGSLLKRLQALPGFMDQAKKNLSFQNITTCQPAIEEIENIKKIIYYYLPQELAVTISEVDSLNSLIKTASDSLESFVTFLKRNNKTKSKDAKLFTPEIYQNFLQLSLDGNIEIHDLHELIRHEYQTQHAKLVNAAELYLKKSDNIELLTPGNNIIEVVNEELEKQVVQKHEIIPFCQATVQDVKQFVNEIWNLSLPTDFSIDFSWAHQELIPRLEIIYLQPPNLSRATNKFICWLRPIPGDKDWIHQLVFLRKYHKKAVEIDIILNALVSHYKIWFDNIAKIPKLSKVFPDRTFVNGWSYYFAFSMLENGYSGYDPALNFALFKKYCRMLFISQLEIQYYSGQLSLKQVEAELKLNNLFKKNEAAELSNRMACFPGENLKTFWGYHQLKSLELAYRKKAGSQFDIDFFLNHVLSLGPVPFSFINDHITKLIGKE
jgi:hypothetical protein